MKCPGCQSEIADDCAFCPRCGRALSPAISPPEPTITLKAASSPAPSPVNAEVLDNLLRQANLSRVRQDWNGAEEFCIQAIRAFPQDPASRSLLGDICRDQNKISEAKLYYQMALDLHPDPKTEWKLREMERKSASQPLKGGLTGSLTGMVAPIGDQPVMGLAPGLWLRGLTIIAISFTMGMLLFLVTGRGIVRNKQVGQSSSVDTSSGAFNGDSSSPLPAQRVGGSSMDAPAAPVPAGSGLPPDGGTVGGASTPAPGNPIRPSTAPGYGSPEPPLNVPTAPVTGTVPMGGGSGLPPDGGSAGTPSSPSATDADDNPNQTNGK